MRKKLRLFWISIMLLKTTLRIMIQTYMSGFIAALSSNHSQMIFFFVPKKTVKENIFLYISTAVLFYHLKI